MVWTLPRVRTLLVAVSLEKVLSAMHVYSPESFQLMSHSCKIDRTKVTPCLVSVLLNTLIWGFMLLVMTLPLGSVHMMEGRGSPLLIHVRSTDWPGSITMFPDDTTTLTGTVGDHRISIIDTYHIMKQASKQTNKQARNIQHNKNQINKQKTNKQGNKTKTKTYLEQLAQN